MQKQQFELNFSGRNNRFHKELKKGNFSVFFEINTPARDCDLSTVLSRLEACTLLLENTEEFHAAFAITDKRYYPDRYNILDFASELCTKDRDKHILFLSGRGVDQKEMHETVEACNQLGFTNIVPVSGEGLLDENIRGISKVCFTESVDALYHLKEKYSTDDFFPGCVINPFKYTPSDLYSQYYKLIKKLNFGANFIVTQTGWDLLKHQELRWLLERREYYVPSLARILFLKPDLIEPIISGAYPGIHISPDFLSILRRESKFGYTQFMAAQWRRIQLNAAGLHFLGYSGIVVAGIENAPEMKTAITKISEALKEFTNFNDWKEAYLNYLARSEMAPYPYRFYAFRNLFKDAYVDITKESNITLPECSKLEKIKYLTAKKIFTGPKQKNKQILFLLKKFLGGCVRCKSNCCYLPATHFVCPELCPKKLRNGPCGGTKADGSCELSGKECVHSKIFRIANWRKELDFLEENYIPK